MPQEVYWNAKLKKEKIKIVKNIVELIVSGVKIDYHSQE